MSFLIQLIGYGLIGGMLGANGIGLNSWSYWIILVAVFVIDMNSFV